MINRRRVLTLMSGAMLAPILNARDAAANPNRDRERQRQDSEGRGGPDESLLYELPLRLSRTQAQLAITTIFILGLTQLMMLRTAAGVDQRNENRVNLTVLPLLGNIIQRTYGPGDFSPANRIGAVYTEGGAMLLFLYPQLTMLPEVRQLLFFNMLYSYALRDGYKTADWQTLASLMPTLCAIETVRRVTQARLRGQIAPVATVATNVAVPDMDTMIMGNLISDDSQAKSGIPGLSDVPLLKPLFRGNAHQSERSELLVLIRPSIVMGDRE